MTSEKQHIPRPFAFAAAPMFLAGVLALTLSWRHYPLAFSLQFGLLLLGTILSENFAFALPEYSISLSYPLTMAGMVFTGPTGAALLAAVSSTNYQEVRSRRPLAVIAYNWGQLVAIAALGGWLYGELGGRFLQTPALQATPLAVGDFPSVLLPMSVVAVSCAALNISLTAIGVSLLRGMSLRDLLGVIAGFMPTQVALTFVGYLIAQVLAISPVALILFIAPLVVARQLYLRYSGLRDAYADTVRSLIGALEAKDPYTRGHSERVAEYAVALGRALEFDAHTLQRLEYAALLHDLGKLAVPGAVLTKPGRLDASEMDRIREHPSRGADMIGRIPPLKDLADVIRQHHERIDGAGYPLGVLGNRISLPARVLAVADSYDAMTTTRSYRPALERSAAVAELLDGAGSQFDPEVVRCFIEARVGLAPAHDGDDSRVASAAAMAPVHGD